MGVWYSFKGKKYTGRAPPYYDLHGNEWYDKLTVDLPDIQKKLLAFLKVDKSKVREYFNRSMVEGTKWEGVSFLFWKIPNENVVSAGHEVFAYFESIKGLVSLSVSILQPQTRIKGHYGDTDAIYRVHIPIYIPSQLPSCGLKVDGISRAWKENELIVFCDAHFHEAWNMSDEPRIILIMDVVKEDLLSQTDSICSNVLSGIKYQEFLVKYKFVKNIPGWARDLLRRALKFTSVSLHK